MAIYIKNGCFESWDSGAVPTDWTPTVTEEVGETSFIQREGSAGLTADMGGFHSSTRAVDLAIDELGTPISLEQSFAIDLAKPTWHFYFWQRLGFDDPTLQALAGHKAQYKIKANGSNNWLGADGLWKGVETWIEFTPILEHRRVSLRFLPYSTETTYVVTFHTGTLAGVVDEEPEPEEVRYEHLYLDNVHCEPYDQYQ